jgi:preprotein translocase subunit SecF
MSEKPEEKAEHARHKFRYLLPPGNNFHFVRKFKTWLVLSLLLMAASVASLFVNKAVRGDYMNWTIDFKGGTEIVVAFKDCPKKDADGKCTGGKYIKADPHTIREALEKSGEGGVDVSDISWEDENNETINGMIIRTPRYSAIPDIVKEYARLEFIKKFGENKEPDSANTPDSRRIMRASWSGDRLNVRSLRKISNADAKEFFETLDVTKIPQAEAQGTEKKKLEVRPWTPEEKDQYETSDVGTKEYNQWYGLRGIDAQYQGLIEEALGKDKAEVVIVQSYGVGAKAGSKLRDDAAKSLIYAIFLIMLYLAFRFDIRYAPGAAFATIHDAVMVIGVFSVTWTEVSLTSVAGLLTVVGFSVNDTVIVFDRIRENQAKLKDKSAERIVDISLNEVLVRSMLTSATVFATTLIMNIFGTGLVQNFAFAMNVGVIVGSYSSLFLAAPFFLFVSRKWYSGPAPARRRGMASPPPSKEKAKPEPEPAADEE